jgi:FkbM family methyltransferase
MKITKEKILNRIRRALGIYGQTSYSQCGEDILIRGLLNSMEITHPYYIDIGAHHPKYMSNTFFFYEKGANGICIEPDPHLFSKIRKSRTRDLCLNVGIGNGENTEAEFFVMTAPTLNTFSKRDAEANDRQGIYRIKKTIKLPLVSINEILEKYAVQIPDLVSIDVEGWDLEILKSLDYSRFRPKLFCIETLSHDDNFKEVKAKETLDFLNAKGYLVIADTWLNTIFADKVLWENRKITH